MGENTMPEIGVRELKAKASEIIRAVWEKRARYLITYRGKPVGILMPLGEAGPPEGAGTDEQQAEVWEELIELGQQIGSGWQSDLTAAELLTEMRR
jgi:prevent-host-death family protein